MESPVTESNQTEKTPSGVHVLSSEARALLLAYNTNALNAKVRIHDLNVQLEQAQKDRDQAEAHFGATQVAIAIAYGLRQPATLSPDFTQMEGAK